MFIAKSSTLECFETQSCKLREKIGSPQFILKWVSVHHSGSCNQLRSGRITSKITGYVSNSYFAIDDVTNFAETLTSVVLMRPNFKKWMRKLQECYPGIAFPNLKTFRMIFVDDVGKGLKNWTSKFTFGASRGEENGESNTRVQNEDQETFRYRARHS